MRTTFTDKNSSNNPIAETDEQTLDFIGSILEPSTEYSMPGKDLKGNFPLWNEGVRCLRGYESQEAV